MNDTDRMAHVRRLVSEVFSITSELERLTGRKFTPDGHLVGSLGEVIAAHQYGLTLNKASTKAHDAVAPDGRKVEVKMTSTNRISLRHEPEHLLVLVLCADGTVDTIYNGPGAPVWQSAGKPQSNGQRMVSNPALRRLNRGISDGARLQPVCVEAAASGAQ